MGYSPTLGRFLSRDPLEYVDGMNPYNYVRNSPLTLLDPFGLQSTRPRGETAYPDFGGEITLPGGEKAKVRVFTGSPLEVDNGRSVQHAIGFEVTTEEGSCADCHFIQFYKSSRYDKDGKSISGMYPAGTWKKYGEWYLDAAWTTPPYSPWYDTHGSHTREDGRLAIFDWPSAMNLSNDESRRVHEFQTFLVCNDEVLWKWTWKAETSRGDGGRWGPLRYTPQSGGAATDLGDFADMDGFPMGFRDPNGNDPIPPYDNPVPPPTGPTTRPG